MHRAGEGLVDVDAPKKDMILGGNCVRCFYDTEFSSSGS
jgi:hypothetical protein